MKRNWLLMVTLLAGSTTFSQKQTGATKTVDLPAPFATPAARNSPRVIGWKDGRTPIAPAGFVVTKFADSLENPRWIYVAPNNDIFVAESRTGNRSPNRITLFRDNDLDGKPEFRSVFLTGLKQNLGMLVLNNSFYVGNTDGLMLFPYKAGQTNISDSGKKILELPAGGYNNHWTRNVIANKDGSKLYISVGSGSNVAENGINNEARRANILEVNPDGTGEKIYASGLRNPVGMAWAPGTSTLWTAVNERDNLGDDLVPDYLTSVKPGAFYGWPYAYFGPNEDPRRKGERPDMVQKTIAPDVSMGAHTASLGLAFYDKDAFPAKYRNGAFVGQHGSWNRSVLSGYKVVFVPFANGKPSGKMEDFLTGFINESNGNEVYGRPVSVAVLRDGSMLVSDDSANTIWRVSAKK
ncbi:sorbosone dehydrogenase family protein [Segetibacter sp. 3557_3]|uniref:PQQ-dependent sugar dehydrogenase n=1 Tax=Segetibacter sp. 3557_3 TaxID=2547429 RepID=UPI001058C81A|nr:sorbosone dehydrogenase family protein [Segetibacter sp. 3557_3]TDH26560.1 sorbosone dehydrogenase family protein [Segetibacter sp. 3557_3]